VKDEFAKVDTYNGLVRAIRARRIALGMSQLAVDARAGLPDGYTAKIEAMLTNPKAANARAIGRESLPLLLGALGLQLAVVRAASTHPEIDGVTGGYVEAVEKMIARRAQLGGEARAKRLDKVQRIESARLAARARWSREREMKAKRRKQTHFEAT